MHVLGLMGMPRRVYTYQPDMGWGPLNMLVTGRFAPLRGELPAAPVERRPQPASRGRCRRQSLGRRNARMGGVLPAPAAEQNFDRIPVVTSSEPLWSERRALPVANGLEVRQPRTPRHHRNRRDAGPARELARPSIWPLVSALLVGATFLAASSPRGRGVGTRSHRRGARRLVLAQGRRGGRGVKHRTALDVAHLPTYAFGTRMTMCGAPSPSSCWRASASRSPPPRPTSTSAGSATTGRSASPPRR